MIHDLKPNTQYEFTVKVVKVHPELNKIKQNVMFEIFYLLMSYIIFREGESPLGAW